jgi:benzoylformate decarboxylase
MLTEAKKPVMIAGTQIAKTGSVNAAVELAELLGLPVFNEGRQSLSTMNFPFIHPFYRGGLDPRSETIRSSDLILAVGCELFVQNSYADLTAGDILNKIKTIHLHNNGAKIAKHYPVDVPILGDVKKALVDLSAQIKEILSPDQTAAIKMRYDGLKTEWEAIEAQKAESIKSAGGQIPITAIQLVRELAEVVGRDAIIVDEAIRSSRPLLQHYPFSQPGTYFRSPGGYLGWGTPAALGIKLARPNQPVISFVGDGAFIISIQALWTAARYNIPVIFVVCNNRLYKAVRDAAVRFQGKALDKEIFIGSSIDDPAPDLARIARGFGVSAATVTVPDEITPALQKALKAKAPFVLDVRIAQ